MAAGLRRQAAGLESHLYCLVTADSKRAYGIAFGVLLAGVLTASTLLFLTGAAPQKEPPWASLILLDGSWRVASGLRPHSDFFDHLGFTSYLPLLAGMGIAGYSSKAFAYGPAALLPLMSIWTWRVVRRRFPAFPALWIATLTGGLIVGTFPLGWPACGWQVPSYAMQYNRFQWSLLCLLAILVFVEPRRALSRRETILEGAGAGFLAGLLLIGKINYSAAALVILGGGMFLGSVRRDRIAYWLAVAAACSAPILAFFVYLHGDVASCWRDFTMLCGVQQPGRRLEDLVERISLSWRELWAFCFVVFVYMPRIFAEDQTVASVRASLKSIAAAALLLGLGLAVTLSNSQFYGIPLWALATIILAESLRRLLEQANGGDPQAEGPRGESALRVVLGYAAAGAVVLAFSIPDFGSIGYAFVWKEFKAARMPADAQVNTPALSGMFCPPLLREVKDIEAIRSGMASRTPTALTPLESAIWVNKGIELLRGRIDEKSRVFTMDYYNPFPYALQLAVPRVAPLCWHYGRLLDDAHHPPVDLVLQEVTHIMVPKRPLWGAGGSAAFVDRLCGGYLKEHFAKAAESDLWTLYVRKPAGAIPAARP